MGKFEQGVAKVTEVVDDYSEFVSDLVSSKKQWWAKQVANAFLLLIILIIFGCFDFLHLKFHYEYLMDPNYWINVGVKAIADICSYNIGVNFIIDDIIKRNKTLGKLKKLYEQLNAVKQEDFPVFLAEYNKEQKILAYKNYINRKIYILNKFSRKADRVKYTKLVIDDSTVLKGYAKKRYALEQMKTDEFINANIDSLEAPYKDVDAAVFEVEINGTQKIVQNKVTGSLAKGRAIASISTMMGVVAFAMIISPIRLDPNQDEFENQMVAAANTAMKMASDIGIIIWQFTRGIFGTQKIVSNQLTVPLAERVKILKRYYEWRRKQGKFVPQCYLETLKEKKIEEKKEEFIEIEMTQEEYDKFKEKEKEVE